MRRCGCIHQFLEGHFEVPVQRNYSSGVALAGSILKPDGRPDLPVGICDHLPRQRRDFLGPKARLDRQEEDNSVPERVSGRVQVAQDGLDLGFA